MTKLPITFTASVIAGSGRGKDMGVPTVNVDLSAVPVDLDDGIYASTVQLEGDDKIYKAAMHCGPRPVFDNSRACEVHLLDTVLKTPPSSATITVVKYLREIQDFPSIEELAQQMQRDIENCRSSLAAS